MSIALNTAVILLIFRCSRPATPRGGRSSRAPIVGAVGWTILQTVGAYFVRYLVTGASDTYGTFAVVIGLADVDQHTDSPHPLRRRAEQCAGVRRADAR